MGAVPNLQNDCYGVSTESGSDRVRILAISILAISGDPIATALGTDLSSSIQDTTEAWTLALCRPGTVAVISSGRDGHAEFRSLSRGHGRRVVQGRNAHSRQAAQRNYRHVLLHAAQVSLRAGARSRTSRSFARRQPD